MINKIPEFKFLDKKDKKIVLDLLNGSSAWIESPKNHLHLEFSKTANKHFSIVVVVKLDYLHTIPLQNPLPLLKLKNNGKTLNDMIILCY